MRAPLIFSTALALCLVASVARAETLNEALAQAYVSSPRLQAEQARLRAVDEGVAVAHAGWRPTVSGRADLGLTDEDRANGREGVRQPKSLSLTLTQPLFRGFRTVAGVSGAQSEVMAARADLQTAEQELLLDVVKAYTALYRDEAVLKLTGNNEQVLGKQLEAAQDRFDVGEITRTDVSQSQSRVARAAADRIQAEAELEISRANYLRLVGALPTDLSKPVAVPGDWRSLDDIVALAQRDNPAVVSARHRAEAADDDVTAVAGRLLPEVNLIASASRSYDQSFSLPYRSDDLSGVVRATVPLYEGGADYARTRAAKQTRSQRQLELDETVRRAREGAVQAWQQLQAATAAIESRKTQVEAAALALDGIKQESSVGTRTTLDVLDAEQEYLDAQVDLVRVESNAVTAVYAVRAAIGQLTTQDLALGVQAYDPVSHYDDNAGKWVGLGD